MGKRRPKGSTSKPLSKILKNATDILLGSLEKAGEHFEMRTVASESISWNIRNKYGKVIAAVARLKIGEALEVKSSASALGSHIRTSLRKVQVGNYRLVTRRLKKAGLWYIKKEEQF